MKFSSLLCLIFVILGCRDAQNTHLYQSKQLLLGTFVEVVSPDQRASKIVFDEIKAIERLLSKYDPASVISRLNKNGRLEVSGQCAYILRQAKEFWLLTEGAFDITVGPLMDLWGFTDRKYRVPQENEIKNCLNLVGMDKILFNSSDNMIEFKTPGVKVDLGGIAKGYAVDCAVKKLRNSGIKSCLINAGGQIYALGDKSGKPWAIGIKSSKERLIPERLELKDRAVSTSGDYEQFFIDANKYYSHIFDPKTGYPVNSGVVSVTVVAQDGLTADALSTSIFILGKVKGLELLKKFPGSQAWISEARYE